MTRLESEQTTTKIPFPDYNILGIRKGTEKFSVSNDPPGLEKRYESPDPPNHFNLNFPKYLCVSPQT